MTQLSVSDEQRAIITELAMLVADAGRSTPVSARMISLGRQLTGKDLYIGYFWSPVYLWCLDRGVPPPWSSA